MTITKSDMLQYCSNPTLRTVLLSKDSCDQTAKKLRDIMVLLTDIGVTEALEPIEMKLREYQEIRKGYGEMLENIWGISWHKWETILKCLDMDEDELNDLPDIIRLAS